MGIGQDLRGAVMDLLRALDRGKRGGTIFTPNKMLSPFGSWEQKGDGTVDVQGPHLLELHDVGG